MIVKSIMTKEINEDGYWLDLNSMYAILFLLGILNASDKV